MSEKVKKQRFCIIIALILSGVAAPGRLDPARYITLDEVRTDMEAYTRTVWAGTEIEKFPLKILSIVRNQRPGDDMILVIGTDERFIKSGAVHGNSGSPVYIDGRLAGALAAGWAGSLEPLYLVRPIEAMMAVGTYAGASGQSGDGVSVMDMDRPLDLAAAAERTARLLGRRRSGEGMLLPLATSLPTAVCRILEDGFADVGLMAVPAGMSGTAAAAEADVPIESGSVLCAVVCSGDINLAAVGTATERIDDTVYGFGHSFTGIGDVAFPMAAGRVHTVVATRSRSFKLASPGPVVGTIEYDQNAAIRGRIGPVPAMVPMTITVDRFDDPEKRTYTCQLAYDRMFTPAIAQLVAASAAMMQGDLPPEHTVRYRGRIAVAGGQSVRFENVSSGRELSDVRTELMGALSLMLNNPFEPIRPEGIDLSISIEPKDSAAGLWSGRVSQTTVKPGQTLTAELTLQSFRAARTTYAVDLTIPDNLPPGKYPLQLMGAAAYESFLAQNAPHWFRVVDAASLLAGLNRVLGAPRNRLYAVLSVPATGMTMRRHALPDLPPTRMLVMEDSKRLEPTEPFRNWIENSVAVDSIISGAVQIELTVEQP